MGVIYVEIERNGLLGFRQICGHGCIAWPMVFAWARGCQDGQVFGTAVAFVSRKTVGREGGIQGNHDAIAIDFGNDAGSSNGERNTVAANDISGRNAIIKIFNEPVSDNTGL